MDEFLEMVREALGPQDYAALPEVLLELAEGPYLPDGELHTVTGYLRCELLGIARDWPAAAAHAMEAVGAVHCALNGLQGYPHRYQLPDLLSGGSWSDFADRFHERASPLYRAWRGTLPEEPRRSQPEWRALWRQQGSALGEAPIHEADREELVRTWRTWEYESPLTIDLGPEGLADRDALRLSPSWYLSCSEASRLRGSPVVVQALTWAASPEILAAARFSLLPPEEVSWPELDAGWHAGFPDSAAAAAALARARAREAASSSRHPWLGPLGQDTGTSWVFEPGVPIEEARPGVVRFSLPGRLVWRDEGTRRLGLGELLDPPRVRPRVPRPPPGPRPGPG